MITEEEEYREKASLAIEQKDSEAQTLMFKRTKLTITIKGKVIQSSATFLYEKDGAKVHLTPAQIQSFSDPSYESITSLKIPSLYELIRAQKSNPLELSFEADKRRNIYLPLNRSAAAGVILAFHNGMRDPVERVQAIYRSDSEQASDEIDRVITTYYISCLKYMTDVDLVGIAEMGEEEHIALMVDDQTCIPTSLQPEYMKLKQSPSKITPGILSFHAVYGAYVLCRPVANKREFRNWILKRYSAFLSSIQQTTEVNSHPDLQAGGTRVNNLAVARPTLRKAVFSIIKSNFKDIRTAAIKTHVKMLTALSEMTTYALVQRVIAVGGSAIFIKPLPEQLIMFMEEKAKKEKELIDSGYEKEDIVYIHLIYPGIQCFKSSDYKDLVVAAGVIEEYNDPKDKTLDRYRAKTEGATIDVKQLKTFLRAQSHTINCAIDEATKAKMIEMFGDSAEALLEEAQRIMKLVSKQGLSD